MATVNKRTFSPQASIINGVSLGGTVSVTYSEGYDATPRSSPDGFQAQIVDRTDQFVRGTITVQDWPDAIGLLTGTVGTYIFYERKAGLAEATGYIKHTFTNPIVHTISVSITKGGYATVTVGFECRAASDTADISDMHAMTDSQAAPTAIAPSLGGWRIVSAVYGGTLNLYHVTALNFTVTLSLLKESNDGDLAYTSVDAQMDGIQTAGSISFQDTGIADSQLTSQQLLLAAIGNLVVTVKQAQGAANKVITIARASFANSSANAGGGFASHTIPFEVTNNLSAAMTLAGANKIITIADAA